MSSFLSITALVVAAGLFAVGLISPLTPSEGNPRLIMVILFGVIPILLCALATFKSDNRVMFFIAGLQGTVTATLLGMLLYFLS